ncbi:hypothetical protein IPMB12_02225 [Zophobihabitans entericus]|uniref:Uncharacterized protein n=1 Tax=Zophobihabitans entericus TaxID=1635327 RepID=A0A6G9IA56_9GAMM|nr:hypothetical protein IPMB12_02225 [Zophobihabitans entericus]
MLLLAFYHLLNKMTDYIEEIKLKGLTPLNTNLF